MVGNPGDPYRRIEEEQEAELHGSALIKQGKNLIVFSFASSPVQNPNRMKNIQNLKTMIRIETSTFVSRAFL